MERVAHPEVWPFGQVLHWMVRRTAHNQGPSSVLPHSSFVSRVVSSHDLGLTWTKTQRFAPAQVFNGVQETGSEVTKWAAENDGSCHELQGWQAGLLPGENGWEW